MKLKTMNIIIALGASALLGAALNHALPALSDPPATRATSLGTLSLGTISGRVTRDDGGPAADCTVVAWSTHYVSPAPAGEAETDADGRYRLRLDTGLSQRVFRAGSPSPGDTQFRVTVEGQEPLYVLPSDRTVTLPPGLTQPGVDFQVTAGPQITIRVRDALTGQPVPGVTAKYLWNLAISNNYQTAAVTDAQGRAVFRVPKLSARLTLVPPGGDTPTVIAAPGYDFYREVSLPHVQDVVWDVRTYPADLPTTPVPWRGVVLAQDGRPAPGAKVSILRSQAGGSAVTDGRGRFTILLPPLAPREYSGEFRGVAVLAEKGDLSAVLVPTPDSTWAGIVVRLTRKPLASYAGTVVGPTGSPEAGVAVSCRGGLEIAHGAGLVRYAVTDAQGRFRLVGPPAGNYQVNLGGGPLGPVTLPPSDPGYPYSSTLLTLNDGEQRDLGRITVLPADEVLAGQVVDHDGRSVTDGITAIVHGLHTNQMASLNGEGRFRVYHVVREALTLDLYRDKDGGTRLGQDSPDLFLKVPVQAGREDVQVVLPAGALPLAAPPTAPVPAPPPVGPPQVSASYGMRQIAGLWMTYSPHAAASDPAQAVIQTTLSNRFGMPDGPDTIWKGSLADMDGMQLRAENNHGVLTDRTGRTLWTGEMQRGWGPTAYQAVSDAAQPGFLTLKDRQGRTLWAGPVNPKVAAVQFLDGYIAVIGTSGRIVWQQPAAPGGLSYRTLSHGRVMEGGGSIPPFSGVIHFAAAPRQAVFQTQDGHVLYSGPLLTLTLAVTGGEKSNSRWNFLQVPPLIFPFSVSNFRGTVTCTLYDAQGRMIQTSTVSRS